MKTIKETAEKIKKGEIKPTELVAQMIAEVKKNNDNQHVLITITEERAMKEAAAAEEKLKKCGDTDVLCGIPYTAKDLFKTKGIRTTGGSKVLADYIPDEDAELISNLADRGSILIGKANLHEFAHGAIGTNPHYGTVANPYDSTRIAGGSSSGSGGAVAYGYGLFSLGTDTGGSVRVPAALCGLVGLKPTYGLLSCKGVIPYCWSLDHVGVITNTVYDMKLVMSSLLKHKAQTCAQEQNAVSGKKIGIPTSFFYDNLDPEIESTLNRVREKFKSLGADIVYVDMPDLQNSRIASLTIQLPEVLSYHSKYLSDRWELYSPDIFAGMAAGQFILAEQYLTAKRTASYYRDEIQKIFGNIDLMLVPSTPCIAPKIGEDFVKIGGEYIPCGNAVTKFFSLFNMTGNPSLTVPAGMHSEGLPIGFQLVGREFGEEELLNTAITYENNFIFRR